MASSNIQRDELHKTIWGIADNLRGSIDGWDFKSYVLCTMFYRYISENLTSYINGLQKKAGVENFDYAMMTDEEAEEARTTIVEEKGYFILPSQLFCNVCKNARKNPDLNQDLNRIFRQIENSAIGTASEDDLRGLFSDFKTDENKLANSVDGRNKIFADVLLAVKDMNLDTDFEKNDIDAFGDAYEFLMTMYASNAGKSGGEFFTPQEVSELLARIAAHNNENIRKVYDPACGSGSLLMKFSKTIGRSNPNLKYFGQEKNPTTYNLCRMNMFLHNINYDNFDIRCEDTLIHPQHEEDAPFDAIVSNPPYSIKWEGDTNPLLINDPRFSPAGVLAPNSAADLAFTMHMLHELAETGTAAIVEFPGVLYRGSKEKTIRKYLIENNYVDTIIQLPSNLFFGVGIATCIIVLKKSAKKDSSILFVDASKLFVKVGNKNKLTAENQDTIFDLVVNRQNVDHLAVLVSNDDVMENDCNLSVSAYVEPEDTREVINIVEVNAKLESIEAEGADLRAKIHDIIANL